MIDIARYSHGIKRRVADVCFTTEYAFYEIFAKTEREFNLKRGRMLLPLKKTYYESNRRLEMREPYTDDILRERLKPGMNVVEIGAAYGYFTLLIADLIGEQGHCYSFEPFFVFQKYLKRNIELNNLKNVTHIPNAVGLSDSPPIYFSQVDESSVLGTGELLDYDTTGGIKDSGEARDIKVEVISLADYAMEHNIKIDMLFTDIEGAEELVFADIREKLPRDQLPEIYFESHQQFYGEERLQKIFDEYKALDFTIRKITPNHYLMTPPGR